MLEEKARILVVDDQQEFCEFLRILLEGEGYEVEEAYSGIEALARLEQAPFDLILTDVRMPGMDGLEMARRAKEIREDVAVIVMTAYASLEGAFEAVSYSVSDYLTKPFAGSQQLLDAVRKGLEKHQGKSA